MDIKRKGSAAWKGGLKDGVGAISTQSGALHAYPYGFASRFEGVKGSNPEELLGAAHAACFTMSLALTLESAGLKASDLQTEATVTLAQQDGGFAITLVELALVAQIEGVDEARFRELAEAAERNCPVSKLFGTKIVLDARLG